MARDRRDSLLYAVVVAGAFILGLTIGFPLGVAAYFGTYGLYQKLNEDRFKKRLIVLERSAFERGKKTADVITQARSRYGNALDASDQELNEEVEKVLGTGPNGRAR